MSRPPSPASQIIPTAFIRSPILTEYRAQLKEFQLFFHSPEPPIDLSKAAVGFFHSKSKNKLYISIKHPDQGWPAIFCIPLASSLLSAYNFNFRPAAARLTAASEENLSWLTMKIPLEKTSAPPPLPNGPDDFPTAAELSLSNYRFLRCRSCGAPVTRPAASFSRIFPLPTSYWAELVDFWYCHVTSPNGETATLDRLAGKIIKANEGQILIGNGHLLLHWNDLEAQNIHIEPVETAGPAGQQNQAAVHSHSHDHGHSHCDSSSSPSSCSAAPRDSADSLSNMWCYFSCSRCSAVLGQCISHSSSLQATGDVHLWKHSILSASEGPENAGRPELFAPIYSFEAWLTNEITALAQAKFQFNFLLHSHSSQGQEDSSKTPATIFLHVFSSDSRIHIADSASSTCLDDILPAIQVGFLRCESSTDSSPAPIPAMFSPRPPELLAIPAAHFRTLLTSLDRRSTFFPPSVRNAHGLIRSFLLPLSSANASPQARAILG